MFVLVRPTLLPGHVHTGIVRNLKSVNVHPFRPVRSWRNTTGPREVIRTASPTSRKRGVTTGSEQRTQTMSRSRLAAEPDHELSRISVPHSSVSQFEKKAAPALLENTSMEPIDTPKAKMAAFRENAPPVTEVWIHIPLSAQEIPAERDSSDCESVFIVLVTEEYPKSNYLCAFLKQYEINFPILKLKRNPSIYAHRCFCSDSALARHLYWALKELASQHWKARARRGRPALSDTSPCVALSILH